METNVIHESFKHGKNFKIGNFCVIGKNVVVGDNVTIENFVLLKEGTVIGNDVFVDSYVRSSGDNKIGNNVTIRFGATIARKVTLEDGVFISPNVMTVYSLPDGSKSTHTLIKKGVFVGTAVTVGPNVTIAEGSIIGVNSYVNKNCSEAGVYIGTPIRKIKSL